MAKIVEVFVDGYSAFYADGERVYHSNWDSLRTYRVFEALEDAGVSEFDGFDKIKVDKEELDDTHFPRFLDELSVE